MEQQQQCTIENKLTPDNNYIQDRVITLTPDKQIDQIDNQNNNNNNQIENNNTQLHQHQLPRTYYDNKDNDN